MLENYDISINSGAPVIHLICCLFYINTGCAAVFMCVCRTADTFILKFTGISAVHIRLIMANILVPRATQFVAMTFLLY